MNEEDPSKIDELNKSLYSRSTAEIRTKRKFRFTTPEAEKVETDWQHTPELPRDEVELNKAYKDSSMSFFTKILIASIIFFILALGIGALLFFKGSNIVSAKNVDILVNSPVSVSGGEPVKFDIQVLNQNNIKLENVNILVDFPEGTTQVEDSLVELKELKETLDDIQPGGMGQKTVWGVLYGEENTKKQIKITVNYQVKGSTATFQKEKVVDLLISSSPISLQVSSFKEINTGQEFEMSVTLNSNSKDVIKNLLLKAAYPFGFTFISSDLKPLSDNSTWQIGDIPPGGKKTLKIKGKLEGQDDEARVFRFMLGAFSLNNNKVIGTEYTSTSQEISIKKPFMTVGVALDGDTENQQYVANFDDAIKVDVKYFNNLDVPITDAEIHVKLSGTAFDKGSVSTLDGLYKSEDNEIVWNGVTTAPLRSIAASEEGTVTFSIVPRDLSAVGKLVSNPDIKLDISIKGKRIGEKNVPENIVSTAMRTMKISSVAYLGGQVVRSSGPFTNTGPVPPKAEQETTYTVIWTIDNTTSSISDVQVQSSLPPYVKWLGKVELPNENIKYNSSDGRLTWTVGSIGTHTSNTLKRRQVAFQVSLKPSITQVGQTPILVNSSYLVGQDDFTGETLRSNLGLLNTRFSTDKTFKEGDEMVAQ